MIARTQLDLAELLLASDEREAAALVATAAIASETYGYEDLRRRAESINPA